MAHVQVPVDDEEGLAGDEVLAVAQAEERRRVLDQVQGFVDPGDGAPAVDDVGLVAVEDYVVEFLEVWVVFCYYGSDVLARLGEAEFAVIADLEYGGGGGGGDGGGVGGEYHLQIGRAGGLSDVGRR